jgi:hypothetical protein
MLMKNNIKQKLITPPLFLMFFHKLNYEKASRSGRGGRAASLPPRRNVK